MLSRLPGTGFLTLLAVAVTLSLGAAPAHAKVTSETIYVFNTFSFLMHGFLVL